MYADPLLRELDGLSKAQQKAWDYILEYAKATGRRCFTYNDLARFWPGASVRININTLERRIRELVKLGILERREGQDRWGRPRAYFCIRPDLFERFVSPPPTPWD